MSKIFPKSLSIEELQLSDAQVEYINLINDGLAFANPNRNSIENSISKINDMINHINSLESIFISEGNTYEVYTGVTLERLLEYREVLSGSLKWYSNFLDQTDRMSGVSNDVISTGTRIVIDSDEGEGAVLTPVIENGVITSVNIVSSGFGYGGTKLFIVSDIGSGATAEVTRISDYGEIQEISVSSGGFGYEMPYVTIDIPSNNATASSSVTSGEVSDITILQSGSGYTSAPSITIDAATEENAYAVATVENGILDSIDMVDNGAGYVDIPTVTIAAPFVDSAYVSAGTAEIDNGRITGLYANPYCNCLDSDTQTTGDPFFAGCDTSGDSRNGGAGFDTAPIVNVVPKGWSISYPYARPTPPSPSSGPGGVNIYPSPGTNDYGAYPILRSTNDGNIDFVAKAGSTQQHIKIHHDSGSTDLANARMWAAGTHITIEGSSQTNNNFVYRVDSISTSLTPGSEYLIAYLTAVTIDGNEYTSNIVSATGETNVNIFHIGLHAKCTASVVRSPLARIMVVDGGAGYSTGDTIEILSEFGAGAKATIASVDGSGAITSISLDRKGRGYDKGSTAVNAIHSNIQTSGDAVADLVIQTGQISTIELNSYGSGFVYQPEIVVDPIISIIPKDEVIVDSSGILNSTIKIAGKVSTNVPLDELAVGEDITIGGGGGTKEILAIERISDVDYNLFLDDLSSSDAANIAANGFDYPDSYTSGDITINASEITNTKATADFGVIVEKPCESPCIDAYAIVPESFDVGEYLSEGDLLVNDYVQFKPDIVGIINLNIQLPSVGVTYIKSGSLTGEMDIYPGAGYTISDDTTCVINTSAPSGISAATDLPVMSGVVSGGRITDMNITAYGSKLSPNWISITVPEPSNYSNAYATANVSAGQVSSISIDTAGDGYAYEPNVSISAPSGATRATATATIRNSQLNSISIVSGGSGYADGYEPDVEISPSDIQPVNTTAAVVECPQSSSINDIVVMNSGFDLSVDNPPIIRVKGKGLGAAASPVLYGYDVTNGDYRLSDISISDSGTCYAPNSCYDTELKGLGDSGYEFDIYCNNLSESTLYWSGVNFSNYHGIYDRKCGNFGGSYDGTTGDISELIEKIGVSDIGNTSVGVSVSTYVCEIDYVARFITTEGSNGTNYNFTDGDIIWRRRDIASDIDDCDVQFTWKKIGTYRPICDTDESNVIAVDITGSSLSSTDIISGDILMPFAGTPDENTPLVNFTRASSWEFSPTAPDDLTLNMGSGICDGGEYEGTLVVYVDDVYVSLYGDDFVSFPNSCIGTGTHTLTGDGFCAAISAVRHITYYFTGGCVLDTSGDAWDYIMNRKANSDLWNISEYTSGDLYWNSIDSNNYSLDSELTSIEYSGYLEECPPINFGESVDIDGNYIIVGSSPNAYIYRKSELSESNWELVMTFEGEAGSSFGSATAISGSYAVASNPSDNSFSVFYRDGDVWSLLETYTQSGIDLNSTFGSSIDIDGNIIVVGGATQSNIGVVFSYSISSDSVEYVEKLVSGKLSDYGYDISFDSDYLVVSSVLGSIVEVFKNVDGRFILNDTLHPLSTDNDENFGMFVDMDGRCKRVAVGGSNIHVYDYNQTLLFDDCRGLGRDATGFSFTYGETGSVVFDTMDWNEFYGLSWSEYSSLEWSSTEFTIIKGITPNTISVTFSGIEVCEGCAISNFNPNGRYCLTQDASDNNKWSYSSGGTTIEIYLESGSFKIRASGGSVTGSTIYFFESDADSVKSSDNFTVSNDIVSCSDSLVSGIGGYANIAYCCNSSYDISYKEIFEKTSTISINSNKIYDVSISDVQMMASEGQTSGDFTPVAYLLNRCPEVISPIDVGNRWFIRRNYDSCSFESNDLPSVAVQNANRVYSYYNDVLEENRGGVFVDPVNMAEVLSTGPGCGALLYPQVDDCDSKVNSITIAYPGRGYKLSNYVPSVDIIGGGGTGAKMNLEIGENGEVSAVNILSGGSGYDAVMPTLDQIISVASIYNSMEYTLDEIEQTTIDYSIDETVFNVSIISMNIQFHRGEIIYGSESGAFAAVESTSSSMLEVVGLSGKFKIGEKVYSKTNNKFSYVTGGNGSTITGNSSQAIADSKYKESVRRYIAGDDTSETINNGKDNFSIMFQSIINGIYKINTFVPAVSGSLSLSDINSSESSISSVISSMASLLYNDHKNYRAALEKISKSDAASVLNTSDDYVNYLLLECGIATKRTKGV